MKRLVMLCLLFLLASAHLLAKRYVIIVSIDGLRPEFYTDSTWGAVTLQHMMRNGTSAKGVISVYPSSTFPAHATMLTGVSPARHGVYYNEVFDEGKESGKWYWYDSSIKSPTLWQVAAKAGLTTAAVSWPVTAGAPVNYNIPHIWSTDRKIKEVDMIRKSSVPAGFLEEIEKNVTGTFNYRSFSSDLTATDENAARIAAYILTTYKPDLLAVHFVCTDRFQHIEGRDGPKVRNAVLTADTAVRRIWDAVEKAGISDSTSIIITGDHGFVNVNTSISPNIWLVQNGLIQYEDTRVVWKAMFHGSGPSTFLVLKDKHDTVTLKKVKRVLSSLPDSVRSMFRIVDKKQLRSVGAAPDAAFALDGNKDVTFYNNLYGKTFQSAVGGGHGSFPTLRQMHTGFIGYGYGFRKGSIVPQMRLQDVTPVVAKLLGISMGKVEGKVPPGMLK